MAFRGPNLGDVVERSHALGPPAPTALIENDDTISLLVVGGGSSITILRYDGIVTLQGTIIAGGGSNLIPNSLLYDPVSDLWVLVGDDSGVGKGFIYTSGDSGATWVQRTTTTSANYVDGLKSIAVNSPGFFVAIEGQATGTDSFTSPDGINWTKNDNIGPAPGEILYGARVRYDSSTGYFALVTEFDDKKAYISSNGTTWVAVSPWDNDAVIHTVIDFQIFGGAWVIVSNTVPTKPHIYLSVDQGQTWDKLGSVPIIVSGSANFPPTAFKNLNGLALIASGNLADTVAFTRGSTA
jgi:hypothetical protein